MDFKNMGKMNLDLSKLDLNSLNRTVVPNPFPKGVEEELAKVRKMNEENSKNMKRTADATEDINAKLDNVNKELEYILNSIGMNFQRVESLGIEEKKVLDEILMVLQNKHDEESKNKINRLLKDKGADFLVNIVVAMIQLQLK